jgi:hypothetical protein
MKQESRKGTTQLLPWTLVVLLLAVLAAIGMIHKPASSPLYNNLRKGELLSTMRIHLLEAIEAEKNAVLALSDEESKAYAEHARQASAGVENNRQEMDAIIRQENGPGEQAIMREFNACWLQFRKLDETILTLACQNTNLKAQHLSTTQGADEMKKFEEYLNGLMQPRVQANRCDQVVTLANEALVAGLKILTRHKPHIEAASDTEMDTIERAIQADDAVAKKALAALTTTPDLSGNELLPQAVAAYDRFMGLTHEVLRLSRLNTNIKSAALSLGKKRLISAQCQDTLATLQQSVQNQQFKATR